MAWTRTVMGDARWSGALGRIATATARIVGPVLLGAGLLGWGSVWGAVALLVGALLTPRIRRELAELRAITKGHP